MDKTKEMRNSESGAHILQSIHTQDLMLDRPLSHVSPVAFATSLRVLIQNWRQGTVGCKGRADVSRSNKKPWKQKGTGRARAGSARSPLWRGGGVIHGPQARVKELSIIKGLRKKVFSTLLSNFITKSAVSSINWHMDTDVPKTKIAYTLLQSIGLENKKVILFINPQDQSLYASFANIYNVHILYFDHPNVFTLSQAEHWLFFKKDMNEFKEMVSKWI